MFRICAKVLLISTLAFAEPAVAGNLGKPGERHIHIPPQSHHWAGCGSGLMRHCSAKDRDFPIERLRRISCSEARDILDDRGFSRIKTVSCGGINYKFTGRWKGKTYRLWVSRATGDLVSMKRIK